MARYFLEVRFLGDSPILVPMFSDDPEEVVELLEVYGLDREAIEIDLRDSLEESLPDKKPFDDTDVRRAAAKLDVLKNLEIEAVNVLKVEEESAVDLAKIVDGMMAGAVEVLLGESEDRERATYERLKRKYEGA